MRRALALTTLVTALSVWSAGCGGRGLGAHNGDEPDGTPPTRDASLSFDAGDEQNCHPQDAVSGNTACGFLVGYAWHGDDCDPILCTCEGSDCDEIFTTYRACMDDYGPRCLGEPDCDAQEITGCMDPCASVAGYYWDGDFCSPIICCCEGPDCAHTYQTVEQCMHERRQCAENPCAAASGYCNYGDAVVPTCVDGHGRDDYINNTNPGVCGMGICCTPCPDENAPGVTYFGHSPQECADIDWGCYANTRSFDNECGCGCIPL